MANTKIAVAIAILLALLQVSCAAARRHGKPAHGDHDGNGTPAVMTVNGFERGEDGGGAASCDGSFHSDDKLIVALSSRWYAGGKRCGEAIRITAESGRNREGTGRGRVRLPWRMPQQHRGFLPSRLEGAQARYGCRRGPRHVVRRLNTLHTELDGRPTTEKLGTTARGSVLPIVITTLSTYLIVEREKIKGPWGPPVKEIARDKNLRTTRGHPFCHGLQDLSPLSGRCGRIDYEMFTNDLSCVLDYDRISGGNLS
uniref:Ripening-related protein grip22 n=1 Tax=Zea mays TaxID=4577 RepID=A0A804LYB4_MAIZE